MTMRIAIVLFGLVLLLEIADWLWFDWAILIYCGQTLIAWIEVFTFWNRP